MKLWGLVSKIWMISFVQILRAIQFRPTMKTFISFSFILLSSLATLNSQILTKENRFVDCAPGSFQFYTASPLATYNWDFGGLGSSSQDTQLWIFPNPGVYTVTVGGFRQDITILSKPQVSIQNTGPTKGCLPFNFKIKQTTSLPIGVTADSFQWFLFPEGSLLRGDSISHTIFGVEPSCDVRLKVFTNLSSCNVDSNFKDYLQMVDTPKINFSVLPSWTCDDSANFTFSNLSTVSIYDTPVYLWSWKQPSPSSFIGKDIGVKNYKNVGGSDTMTLRITTKFGCYRESIQPLRIDTTNFSFTFADTICASKPMGEWQLKISLDSLIYGYQVPVTTSTFYASIVWTDFRYEMGVFDVPTGHYPMTVSKYRLDKPSCFQEETQDVYVINDRPIVRISAAINCNSYMIDTVFVSGWTPNVKSARVEIGYVDQFNGIMRSKTVGVLQSTPYVIDTFYYPNDVDSFFRNGHFGINARAEFSFYGVSCTLETNESYTDTVNFYTWVTSNKMIACLKDTIMFKAFPSPGHQMDSVQWLFDDGSPLLTSIVDSPYHKDTVFHRFLAAGTYKVRAVAYDKKGCSDTSQGFWVSIGDYSPPSLYVDKDTICYNEELRISKIGPEKFENLFFVTDSFREMNCPKDTTVLWKGFNHTGMQTIYLYATNNGCQVVGTDSVYVRGPKFTLDYQLDCSRPDSVFFFIRDTFGIGAAKYNWYFGDTSSPFVTSRDSIDHKFASGDFKIRVDAFDPINPLVCPFYDTVELPIRKVKAVLDDTFFCKYNVARFDPLKSIDYGYQCSDQRFVWQLTWGTSGFLKLYTDTALYLILPADTTSVSLIARAINGCEDTITRRVISSAGNLQFQLNKNFRYGQYYCRPQDTIKVKSSSSTPFKLAKYIWSILKLQNGTETSIDYVTMPPTRPDTFFVIDPIINASDTFIVSHGIQDSALCNIGFVRDTVIFYNDHAQFLCPDTVCENTDNQIRLTTYDPLHVTYSWYKDYVLLPNDTTNILQDRLQIKGGAPTPYIFKIIRSNFTSGCVDSFIDTTVVNLKPRLSFLNTFDASTVRCHPGASTTFSYFDSANTNLHFYWRINGIATGDRPNNPFTISLNPGETVLEGSFTTTYGCKDTWVNRDTVINLKITMTTNKPNICRGDTVIFRLSNMKDVDTLKLTLGDGRDFITTSLANKTNDSFKYYYGNVPLLGDTATINYIASTKGNICPPIFGSFNLFVKSVDASFHVNSGDTMFCFQRVPIQNTSILADSFLWDFGNGTNITDPTKSLNSFDYPSPGTYKIFLYGYRRPENCVDTFSREVTLYPNPVTTAKLAKDTICFGEALNIDFSVSLPNSKLNITPDSLKKGPYSSSPITTYMKENGVVIVESVSENNCRDTVKLFVNVLQPKKIKPFDTIVSQGSKVRLPFVYDSTWRYSWKPALLNPSCVDCSNPEMKFIDSARYLLVYSNTKNCFLDSSIFTIRLYKDILVKFPEAFTPNGDNINDQMCPRGFGMKRLKVFKVYNRLGQLIFLSENEDNCWDGTYKGVLQNQDIYYYTYEAEAYIPGKILKGEGNFILLR